MVAWFSDLFPSFLLPHFSCLFIHLLHSLVHLTHSDITPTIADQAYSSLDKCCRPRCFCEVSMLNTLLQHLQFKSRHPPSKRLLPMPLHHANHRNAASISSPSLADPHSGRPRLLAATPGPSTMISTTGLVLPTSVELIQVLLLCSYLYDLLP